MIARISYYGFLLAILVYSLPLLAFGLTAHYRFGNLWLVGVQGVTPQYYLDLLVFTELVWVLAANHYKLSSVTNLFREYTGIRTAFRACLVTLFLQAALLVFVKLLVVSRIFILLSNGILFLLVVLTRTIFRRSSESSAWPRKSEKILVVGTDDYSQRSVNILRRIPFFRCQVQAYLQLPGQPVLVNDAPVITTQELPALDSLSLSASFLHP
jgi:hypothetical protein